MNKHQKDDQNLINWVKKNNGFIHPDLYINTKLIGDKVYRSVYYKNKNPIDKNSALTKIPDKLVISQNKFNDIPNIDRWTDIVKKENDPKLQKIFKSDDFKLIMVLLHEATKKEGSFYYPYIKILLEYNDFYDHPIYLHHKNRDAFKALSYISKDFIKTVNIGSDKLTSYINIILSYNKQFQIFNSDLASDVKLTQMIIWAFFIKVTRSWDEGLMPFDDMFNHSNKSNIHLINNSNKTYNFKADNQFDKKNGNPYEIFVNYGHHSAISLTQLYNFLPGSRPDYLHVPFKFNPKSAFGKLKKQEMKKCKLSYKRILLSNIGPSTDLLTIFRILSLTQDEYDILSKNSDKNKYKKIISYENELKSVKLLIKAILNLKKSTYTMKNLNEIYTIVNGYKNKKLSPVELVINNVCLVKIREYKAIDDSLNWLHDRLSLIISNSNITKRFTNPN